MSRAPLFGTGPSLGDRFGTVFSQKRFAAKHTDRQRYSAGLRIASTRGSDFAGQPLSSPTVLGIAPYRIHVHSRTFTLFTFAAFGKRRGLDAQAGSPAVLTTGPGNSQPPGCNNSHPQLYWQQTRLAYRCEPLLGAKGELVRSSDPQDWENWCWRWCTTVYLVSLLDLNGFDAIWIYLMCH